MSLVGGGVSFAFLLAMPQQPDAAASSTSDASMEKLGPKDAATFLLDECRMVLPGIQALFGFQLIAVFNAAFAERLSPGEQRLHISAIALVVVAIGLIMTPATLHRHAEPRSVSTRFVEISSQLLMWSMAPLSLGISLDVFLVSRIVFGSRANAALLAAVLFAMLIALWFVLPKLALTRRALERSGG